MSSHERHPHSRLPDDPAWWDDLAARSLRAALATTGGRAGTGAVPSADSGLLRHGRDAWWRALSDSAVVLAASALVALLGGALLIGDRGPSSAGGAAVTSALAPEDPLLRTLLGAPAGPDGAALLRLVALREEQR